MADPIDTAMPGGDVFVGSREKSRAGYGTNGDPNPSSVHGKQPPLANPKVAPPAVNLSVARAGDGFQTRDVGKSTLAPAHGQASRSNVSHPDQIGHALARQGSYTKKK